MSVCRPSDRASAKVSPRDRRAPAILVPHVGFMRGSCARPETGHAWRAAELLPESTIARAEEGAAFRNVVRSCTWHRSAVMERALEERRRRANAAWELVRADAIRLGEALGHEASEIRETVRRMAPAAIYRARPLAIAGAATAAAFVVGYRRGRRAAFLARIERASVGEPSPGARGA